MPLLAQESQKTWRISDPGQAEVYNTQQEAADAIKDLVAPSPYDGAYEYVDTIKETRVSESGEVAVTYWMGLQQPSDPDWAYRAPSSYLPHATEAEAVAAQISFLNGLNPACPTGATLTPTGDWVPQIPDAPEYAEKAQVRHYATTVIVGNNTQDSPCRSVDFGETLLQRLRRFGCPKPYTDWSDEYQACANDEITATITSKTEECESAGASAGGSSASGLVGNPCNVKTGDKYQPEPDFDFGWIAFARYYHSVIAVSTGGFGPGWTHSHSARLSINGASMSLIHGSGFQVRFNWNGNAYIAANSSGDRLVAEQGLWILYRSDNVLVFDAKGWLVEQRNDDGTRLTYSYDSFGRLEKIAHSLGRSIQFLYADTSSEARIVSIVSGGVTLASYTYSENGQVDTVTYPGGGARTYHYEDSRFPLHLTGITDENESRFSTYAYDEKGRVISSEHAGGADHVGLQYSAQGGAIVTDALGHQTNYALTTGNATRKLSNVSDSHGSLSYIYYDESFDFRNRLDTMVDRRGMQTKHTYGEVLDTQTGDVVRVHTTVEAQGSPQERLVEVSSSVSSNRLLKTKVGTSSLTYSRNSRLQPLAITVTDTVGGTSRTQSFTYCELADVASGACPQVGLVVSVNGPRTDVSDVTTYTYYPSDDASCAASPTTCPHRKGDLWMVQDAVGNITETLKYDGAGRVLSVMAANGVITDFEYHPRGWLAARKVRGTDNASDADDQITRIEYYPTGLVQKTTLPDGTYTAYTYDAAHRLTDLTDGEGNTIHYTLDNAGNRTKEETKGATGTVLRTLSRVYNQLGQLQTYKDAYSHGTGYAYDANGNTDTVTDALSRITDNDYDPLNHLSKTIKDVGGLNVTTKFKYDAQDHLTEVIDPKNLSTKYGYNGLGDLLQLDSPDTGITGYTYDSAGNRKTETDARNVTAVYGYDALNRITSITHPDSSLNVGYSYDTAPSTCPSGETFAAGRLSQLTDSSGHTQYCYDRFGQLARKVQVTNGQAFTVRYGYTKAGQLSSVTYPDGTVADYVRDGQGRTTEVGVTRSGNPRQVLLTAANYYPFGPVAEWAFGNGRLFQRTLNQNYQPGIVQDQSIGGLSLGYEFDAVGNLVKLRNGNQNEPPLRRYAYDALNRLTESRAGSTDTLLEAYSYDATGNRLSTTDNGATKAHTIATSNHRLMDVGGEARSYDNAGNTLSIGNSGFAYNEAGRMSQAANGSATATYAYNGMGERVRRTVGSAGTIAVYDEAGRWLGEYGSTGDVQQQVIWLDNLPVGVIATVTTSEDQDNPGDPGPGDPIGPLPSTEGNITASSSTAAPATQLHYVEPDHLGTPRVVVDPSRNVAIWKWDLTGDVFGGDVPVEDVDGDGSSFVFNLRFPGQRYDAVSKLNYNYFRDYDPASGRYVQSDPIGLRGGISTYGYVAGAPLALTDPYGLACNAKGCWVTDEERQWANNGDWDYYYKTACDSGDTYACRANEVASQTGSTMARYAGALYTNVRLADSLAERDASLEQCPARLEEKMDNIRIGLVRAHVRALDDEHASPSNPVILSGSTIARFHDEVFLTNGAGEVFGGNLFGRNIVGRSVVNFVFPWCTLPSCKL